MNKGQARQEVVDAACDYVVLTSPNTHHRGWTGKTRDEAIEKAHGRLCEAVWLLETFE